MTDEARATGPVLAIQDRIARSNLSAKLHAKVFRLSGGRVGGVVQGKAVLLLATTGRRSGQCREVVVMYLRDGDRYLVIPSNAADPDTPPAWWRNLAVDPRAQVLVDGRWQDVEATALDDEERDAAWPAMITHNPNWERFQQQSRRRFPVVALTRSPRV